MHTPHESALAAAMRPQTDKALIAHIVDLRSSGHSYRAIAARIGRCMEGVRQILLRYEVALQSASQTADPDDDLIDVRDVVGTLPPRHPIAMRGLWRGLEHWRQDGQK